MSDLFYSSNTYDDNYFIGRHQNDSKRITSFLMEKNFLMKHTSFEGTVCDIGCSTGEFLKTINWNGTRYGMEVNESAIKTAISNGISFNKNILNEKNYFDLVVFRGTIQHLPDPFGYIAYAYKSLKPGGIIAFLATPNSNSLVYKLFNDLPALDSPRNFYIPSDITLKNICKNAGFLFLDSSFPYVGSPYSNLLLDHFNFLTHLLLRKSPNFPFWGSMMNMVFQKPFN